MTEWQPVETAPRDHKAFFLIHLKSGEMCVALYERHEELWIRTPVLGDYVFAHPKVDVTHWMPLPEPPKESET